MNNDMFIKLIDATVHKIKNLSHTKGQEYCVGEADRLENFKGEGENLGLSPLVIWSVYASKHYRAIQSYIRNQGTTFSDEPIEGRIDDLILYLLLLKGLLEDTKQACGIDTEIGNVSTIPYKIHYDGRDLHVLLTPNEYNYYKRTGGLQRDALARNHLD